MEFIQTNGVYSDQWSLFGPMEFIRTNGVYSDQWSLFRPMEFIQTDGVYSDQWSLFRPIEFIHPNRIILVNRFIQTNSYSFLALTTDQSAVRVDGRKVLEGHGSQEGVVVLKRGRHSIQVEFQKLSGVDTAFNLLWKIPGSQNYRIVPFWQWNPLKGQARLGASNT